MAPSPRFAGLIAVLWLSGLAASCERRGTADKSKHYEIEIVGTVEMIAVHDEIEVVVNSEGYGRVLVFAGSARSLIERSLLPSEGETIAVRGVVLKPKLGHLEVQARALRIRNGGWRSTS